MVLSVGFAPAQTDSDPVLQGSATYTMPQTAIDADMDGTVVVGIRVDNTGKPTEAALMSGPMWPCGTRPMKAFEDLSSTLRGTMLKLKFDPAKKDGKPVMADIAMRFQLKNGKREPTPTEIDPVSGKRIVKVISGGVLNGKATYLPKPSYPNEAKANRDGGPVTIQVLVSEDGSTTRAGAVGGAPTLQFAAREAACGAKFSPTKLEGRAVKVSGVITYNFVP